MYCVSQQVQHVVNASESFILCFQRYATVLIAFTDSIMVLAVRLRLCTIIAGEWGEAVLCMSS